MPCLMIDQMEKERWKCYPNGHACETDPMMQNTHWNKRRMCATSGIGVSPEPGHHIGEEPDCKDCRGNPGKCKLVSRCSGWSTRNAEQGGVCKTGCETIFPTDGKLNRLMGPIQCCTKEPKLFKNRLAHNLPEVLDDRAIGSVVQTRGTAHFNENLALGKQTICWNTKRFCLHVSAFFSQVKSKWRWGGGTTRFVYAPCGVR